MSHLRSLGTKEPLGEGGNKGNLDDESDDSFEGGEFGDEALDIEAAGEETTTMKRG
jgi:hypothetical protein